MRIRTVSRYWVAGLAVVAGWLMVSSEVRAQGGFGGQQGGGQLGMGGQQGGFGGQQGGFGGQQGGFGNLLGGLTGLGMSGTSGSGGSLAGGFLGSSQGFRPSGNTGLNNRLPGASNSTNPFDAYRGDPRNSGTTGNATGMNNRTGNMTGMNNRLGNMTGMNQFGNMNRLGNMSGLNQFGNMNRMGNMSGMGMNGMNGQAAVQPGYVLRPNIQAPPAVPPGETVVRLQNVLTQSTSLPSLQGLNLRLEGEIVVLSGTVATDSERTLSEAILRLEPGVYRVKNEIQVKPPSP